MIEHLTFRGGAGRLVADRWPIDDGSHEQGVVLLLHGGGQTRHSWRTSGARFARHGWTAIAVDARGHGDSDWARDGDYSMDALVADLRTVTESLSTTPVLIGASMGGMTALVGQGEAGDLARALVLVDIAPRTEAEGIRRIQDFMTAHRDGFASLEDVADAVAAYNPHRARTGNLEGLKKNVRLRADGRWYWHWDPRFLEAGDEPRRLAGEERLVSAARALTVPTMLIRGASSDVVTPESAAEFQRMVPHAHLSTAVAGHMVAGDDNDVFAQSVLAFLEDAVTVPSS